MSFNPSLFNSWQWTFGYDSLRRLTSYTTTARAATSGNDNYSWNYDEVGNRTSEIYNLATTNYTYDTGNATSQLQSLSGTNSRTWTYDSNGDVVQDHTTGISGTWNQYAYSTRHHLARLDYYTGSTFQYTLESYQDDGRDRRWQKTNHNGAWTQFYYDHQGRVLEEYQNNGLIVNGCAAYDIVDHIYLATGAHEVGRFKRRFQSGAGCGTYAVVDKDILYVHEDYRRTAFALESKSTGLLVWEAETSPYGIVVHEGLPGVDGIIGTPDDGAYTDTAADNNLGLGEQYRDQESSNLASGNSMVSTSAVNRLSQPIMNVASIFGASAYSITGGTAAFLPAAGTGANLSSAGISGATTADISFGGFAGAFLQAEMDRLVNMIGFGQVEEGITGASTYSSSRGIVSRFDYSGEIPGTRPGTHTATGDNFQVTNASLEPSWEWFDGPDQGEGGDVYIAGSTQADGALSGFTDGAEYSAGTGYTGDTSDPGQGTPMTSGDSAGGENTDSTATGTDSTTQDTTADTVPNGNETGMPNDDGTFGGGSGGGGDPTYSLSSSVTWCDPGSGSGSPAGSGLVSGGRGPGPHGIGNGGSAAASSLRMPLSIKVYMTDPEVL